MEAVCEQSSCGAATRVKPKARLCEPWVTRPTNIPEPRSGARWSQFIEQEKIKTSPPRSLVAAPRLQQIFSTTQGSQSLALGLTLAAAPQLVKLSLT